MIIFFCFLLPLLLYIVLHRFYTAARTRLLLISILIIPTISASAVVIVTRYWGQWPQQTQIVWTGVEAADGQLNIGGVREESLIGWPNGSFSPSLTAKYAGTQKASLNISGGGAFVYDDTKKIFLNGVNLQPGVMQKLDGLNVRYNKALIGTDQVEVLNDAAELLSAMELPERNPKKDQVLSLSSMVGNITSDNLGQAKKVVTVENWATHKRLMRAKDGSLLLLGDKTETRECALPCRLTLHWPTQRLPVIINGDGKKLALVYLPPWRTATPLPPQKDGKLTMIVTGTPRPDDMAFKLPLGYGPRDPRRLVEFEQDTNGLPVFKKGPGVTWGQTPPPIYLPPEMQPIPEEERLGTGKNVSSHLTMQIGDTSTSLALATVSDLPDTKRIIILLLVAYLIFAAAVFLVSPVIPEHNSRRLLLGLAAGLWNLMAFRLMLSLRFALEPNYLDDLTVKGTTLAFTGLVLVPALVLLWVRLRCYLDNIPDDFKERTNAFGWSMFLWGCITAGFGIAWFQTPQLWANVQPRFLPSTRWTAIFVVLLLYLLMVILMTYRADHDDPRTKGYRFVFLGPLRFDVWLSRAGRARWADLAQYPLTGWSRTLLLMPAYLVASFIAFAALPLLVLKVFSLFIIPSLVREVIILFFFCLVPALMWLSSKIYHTGNERVTASRWRQLFFAVVVIWPIVFAVPIAMGDAGSVLATLSIVIPTTFLLLVLPSRRTGWVSLIALTFLFLCSTFVYKNLLSLIPILPGESEVRLLVFREGPETVSRVLFADTTDRGDISLHKLRDAYQHSWENQAMVYEGQWLGVGYGNARTRNSQVRQDTLQYDSLYSFFIASEHGFLGSQSLLLLYATPLMLVFLSGWRGRIDFGRAVAIVICSAFWLEALFHAGMNVGAFPLTGRNIPLASINSLTDLLRWLFLFAFAAQAVLWRFSLTDSQDEESDMEDADLLPGNKAVATGTRLDRYKGVARYALGILIVIAIPVFMFGRVAWMGGKLILSSDYQNPFEWKGVLARVDAMIRDRKITIDPNTGQIAANLGFDVPNSTLIEQEILRFNAFTLEEKLEGENHGDFITKMKNLKSVEQFNQLLDNLRRGEIAEHRDLSPSLFRLLPPLKVYDGDKVEERGGYRLTTNPAFNSQLSFHSNSSPDLSPRVTFRDGNKVLIGPAWVSGKWVTVFDPDISLSWLKLLGRALDAEWTAKRLTPQQAKEHYGTLSLDDSLHLAAIRFTADKGKNAYQKLFETRNQTGTASDPNEENNLAFPPRVALAVLNFQGEVLALGGYPRMTAGNEWRGNTKDGWLPSSEWIEQEAPRSLRSFFAGDRNFDRMVVGSASKPMWAEVVLSIHESLDRDLAVNGSGGSENRIFGIPIEGSSWEVGESRWTNFTQFLSQSDNRYQVRLGFLGLATHNGPRILDDGASPSVNESLNGGKSSWSKYPKFIGTIGFSKSAPQSLTGLADTPLAQNFERMFAVVVGPKNFGDRYSFWTKNQTDDRDSGDEAAGQKGRASVTRLFGAIAPERVDLNLDEIKDPRGYVTLLLGGGSNRWSNVDLAAAFGTCLTGHQVVAHIVKNDLDFNYFEKTDDADARKQFVRIAAKVRPGLEKVVQEGTAARGLGTNGLLAALKKKGYRVYAKTGTLHSAGTNNMSRIVLAIVKWKNEANGEPDSGLIFSLVGERANTGDATVWLGEFLDSHQKEINSLLGSK